MKKLVLLFVVLALAGAAFFLYFRRAGSHTAAAPDAAAFLPADTVALIELSDVARSRKRWKETGLHQILHEPEVEAFLEKSKSQVSSQTDFQAKLHESLAFNPLQAFAAVTDISGAIPKVVAGFSYSGKKEDVTAWIGKMKTEVQRQWPAGKTDLVQYGEDEIETFDAKSFLIASSFRKDWYFISNDIDLLKATLDRAAGKIDPAKPSLAESPLLKSASARVAKDWDTFLFAQPHALIERLTSLAAAAGQPINSSQMDEVRKLQAVAATTKMEGEDFHDTLLVLNSGTTPMPALSHGSLALTSTDTVLYFALGLNIPTKIDVPDASGDITGLLLALGTIDQHLAGRGISLNDLASTFGPELGILLDWPASSSQPSLLVSLDTRDAAKAKKFLDAATEAGTSPWAKQDIDGNHYYIKPAEGFSPFSPTLALTDKAVLAGGSFDAVRNGVTHLKSAGPTLEKSAAFSTAMSRVPKPESEIGYIDSRAFWERFYAVARPMLAFSGPLIPHLTDYLDLNKLPATETISKHLKPTVLSRSSIPEGYITESVGTVTFNQAVFGTVIAAGIAVAENAQTLESFGFTLPSPFGKPAATPANPPGSGFAPGVPVPPVPPATSGTNGPAPE